MDDAIEGPLQGGALRASQTCRSFSPPRVHGHREASSTQRCGRCRVRRRESSLGLGSRSSVGHHGPVIRRFWSTEIEVLILNRAPLRLKGRASSGAHRHPLARRAPARRLENSEGLRAAKDFAEIFEILGEAGFVATGSIPRLKEMARFRNLLVHEYAAVDDHRVVEILQSRLDDFHAFKAESPAPRSISNVGNESSG